jgi:arabinofuranosyltransferase
VGPVGVVTETLAATGPPDTGPDAGPTASRPVRLLVLLLPAVLVGIGGWIHRWTDEDAFINYRIVDQIFAGHGPVFNAGERVETYTSAAWLAVLAVARVVLGWLMGPEWISVLLGLAAAVGGFVLAAVAGRRLCRPDAVVVPLGLLAVAAVPVVWDFATSGLEMGLVWLWIGASFFALARLLTDDAPVTDGRRAVPHRGWWLVVVGLGPLVRPDLGLMTVVFLIAWVVLARPRRIVGDLAIALALPVLYQVFRMGYFASLVPSTALAKDSGGLHLDQGWNYLRDLVDTYWLWIPLLVLVVAMVVRAVGERDVRRTVVVGALVAAGVLHGTYIVVTGGDYMHGRLLLPGLFAVAAPASFAVPRLRASARAVVVGVATAVVIVWSAVVVVGVRYPAYQPSFFGVADISDWRSILHGQMFHHPDKGIGISIYRLRARFDDGMRGYLRVLDRNPRPGRDPKRLVLTLGSIGLPGWVIGPDVFVIDIGGLGEPLAARSAPIANRAAGHRKEVSYRWYDARFGAARGDAGVEAARRALRCQPLKGLIDAIDEPMSVGRFLSNVWHAPEYTRLEIPRNPRVAERKFCGTRR